MDLALFSLSAEETSRTEAGFIFVGGGGNGCAGRGCLFWIVLSVVASVLLTVGVNLALAVF